MDIILSSFDLRAMIKKYSFVLTHSKYSFYDTIPFEEQITKGLMNLQLPQLLATNQYQLTTK